MVLCLARRQTMPVPMDPGLMRRWQQVGHKPMKGGSQGLVHTTPTDSTFIIATAMLLTNVAMTILHIGLVEQTKAQHLLFPA